MKHAISTAFLFVCLSLILSIPSFAAEKAKIRPGHFAADTESDYIRARDYAIKRDTAKMEALYAAGRIFALPENVTVEIVAINDAALTCRIGIPQSGKYYWTSTEAVKPGYRPRPAHPTQQTPQTFVPPKEEPLTNEEAVRRMSNWFLSKPIAGAERGKTADLQGIDHQNITDTEDDIVENAKKRGLPIHLAGTRNATVIVSIGETVLGHVDYSKVPVDFAKNRSWTACLYASNGQLAAKQTTSENSIAFQITAGNNDQGTWRVRLENVNGYLDKQIVLTTVVNELVELKRR